MNFTLVIPTEAYKHKVETIIQEYLNQKKIKGEQLSTFKISKRELANDGYITVAYEDGVLTLVSMTLNTNNMKSYLTTKKHVANPTTLAYLLALMFTEKGLPVNHIVFWCPTSESVLKDLYQYHYIVDTTVCKDIGSLEKEYHIFLFEEHCKNRYAKGSIVESQGTGEYYFSMLFRQETYFFYPCTRYFNMMKETTGERVTFDPLLLGATNLQKFIDGKYHKIKYTTIESV